MSAAEVFCPDGQLHALVIKNSGQLEAAAPLLVKTRWGLSQLEIVGASSLFEPCGLLFKHPESLTQLCRVLVAQKWPVALQRIYQADLIEQSLRSSLPAGSKLSRSAPTCSPFVRTHGDWDQYFQSLSSRRRYDNRRSRARLEKHGNVSVTCLTPSPQELTPLLDLAFRIESSGWKGQKGSGLAVNPKLRHFFRAYSQRAAAARQLRLCFLNVQSHAIAMQMAVVANDSWWVLKTGYDEKWADYSPGMLLTMETVRHVFDQKLEKLEFLGTSEPWLRVWAREDHAYSSLHHFPSSLMGRVAWASSQCKKMLGKTKRRFKKK